MIDGNFLVVLFHIQGEFQSKQNLLNLAPSSGAIYMSTAILYRLPVKIS